MPHQSSFQIGASSFLELMVRRKNAPASHTVYNPCRLIWSLQQMFTCLPFGAIVEKKKKEEEEEEENAI